jgi:hypothetical protein
MPNYTSNYSIYKWDKTDEKATTIQESANNADKIDTELYNQKTRIDNLVLNGGDGNPEIVDARGGFPLLRNRLENVDASLADIAYDI